MMTTGVVRRAAVAARVRPRSSQRRRRRRLSPQRRQTWPTRQTAASVDEFASTLRLSRARAMSRTRTKRRVSTVTNRISRRNCRACDDAAIPAVAVATKTTTTRMETTRQTKQTNCAVFRWRLLRPRIARARRWSLNQASWATRRRATRRRTTTRRRPTGDDAEQTTTTNAARLTDQWTRWTTTVSEA